MLVAQNDERVKRADEALQEYAQAIAGVVAALPSRDRAALSAAYRRLSAARSDAEWSMEGMWFPRDYDGERICDLHNRLERLDRAVMDVVRPPFSVDDEEYYPYVRHQGPADEPLQATDPYQTLLEHFAWGLRQLQGEKGVQTDGSAAR